MPLYHFKLVDTRIVGDHGTHDLATKPPLKSKQLSLRDQRARRVRNLWA